MGTKNGVSALPALQGTSDYEIGHGRPPKQTQFKVGVSGNPGGVKRGTVFLSEVYKRLCALTPNVFDAYEPKNVAEEIGVKMIQRARGKQGKEDALSAAKEIADRTEGKAPQNIKVETKVNEGERIITRLQERFLARTGVELSREDAIARLVEIDPGLRGSARALTQRFLARCCWLRGVMRNP